MKRHPSPHALTHALAMASLLLAPATGWAAPGPQAGVSAAVRGSVLLGEVGHPDVVGRAVVDGDAVYLGNAIKAGPAAGMQLMLLDQTTVTLGENAELAVDEFIYDPAQNTGQISMNLTKGAFRLVTGGVSDINPANTRVKTPTATIGIRGTIVLANVSPAGTLIALGGPGPNSDSRDRVGAVDVSTPQGSVSITRPGFATFVANGQAPETPRPLTAEESASLSGGLSKDGDSSGDGDGGSTSEEGAAQATEASGTSTSEGAAAAEVVSTQADSTSTAADQTASNTQSSEYGNEGSQLASIAVVQQYRAAPEEEPPAEEPFPDPLPVPVKLSWAEALQSRGAAYTIARAADLAGLSGTATYTRLGVPLFDTSGLDEEARNRLWFTSDFSGLTQVGRYDFSAKIDFGLRRAYANWTRIKLPGDDSYYTLAADDTGGELPALLAYDENEEPVFRVEGETNVPTRYLARARGAFISGTGDPNAAPGKVIQGLGIYVRNGAGGVTPLYGGGGRADKDVYNIQPLAEDPPVETYVAEIVDTDFFFVPDFLGGAYSLSDWTDLTGISDGTTLFSASNIGLDYKDAAEDSWTEDPESRFDFSGTIDFTARSFEYGLNNVILSGTNYGGSSRNPLEYGTINGDAIDTRRNFVWIIGADRDINGARTDILGSIKFSFYSNCSTYPCTPASLLAAILFLATPGRLYHGTSQMNGTYTAAPVIEPPEDPWQADITEADFTFVTNQANGTNIFQSDWSADLSTITNGTSAFSASNIPLEYRDADGDPWKTAPNSSFDFSGTVDFTARTFTYNLRNVVLNLMLYGDSPQQTLSYGSLSGSATAYNRGNAWGVGPSGTLASIALSFYNDSTKTYPNNFAAVLAAELFLATPGRLYHGTSRMNGTYTVPGAPVVDTFDISVFAGFEDPTYTSSDDDINSLGGPKATYQADGVSLEQRAAGSNGPWSSGAGSYSFNAEIDFGTHNYSISFYNINIGNGVTYNYNYNETLPDNTTSLRETAPFISGPPNSNLAFQATFMNNDIGGQASQIAQQLFIATEGTSYRGRSNAVRTVVQAPPAADPYARSENPADAVYEADNVQLKNGALDGGSYNLDATVSFMNRSITTSVEFTLLNGWNASGTSNQDFSSEDVTTNTAITLSNQEILAPGSLTPVPGVTLNEVIRTNDRPDASELGHDLQVQQGVDTYTGGANTPARPPI